MSVNSRVIHNSICKMDGLGWKYKICVCYRRRALPELQGDHVRFKRSKTVSKTRSESKIRRIKLRRILTYIWVDSIVAIRLFFLADLKLYLTLAVKLCRDLQTCFVVFLIILSFCSELRQNPMVRWQCHSST